MTTMPQSVELRRITENDACSISGSAGVTLAEVGLGGASHLERELNRILNKMRQGTDIFLLEWEGSKVPRGIVVGGKEIAWTQHGRVISPDGDDIGTYQRLMEFGGLSKQHHRMLIYKN